MNHSLDPADDKTSNMLSSSRRRINQLAVAATPMTIGKEEKGVTYTERTIVRAILFDPATEKIILIHVSKGDYFKLPGSRVELDEDHAVALARDLLQETGCEAVTNVSTCFAKCEEYRNDVHQVSFCYVAVLTKDTGRRAKIDLEMCEGLRHAWVSLREAIKMMVEAKPTTELGKFVTQRDLFFVEKFMDSCRVNEEMDDFYTEL